MQSPANKNNRSRGSSLVASLIIIVLWFAVAGALVYNRQGITDWYRLRNYQPSTKVAQIADQSTMTEYGKKIFYVNAPDIKDKASFKTACPNNGGEKTNILGCYRGKQNGIYVLNVSDPRLDGVVQVTSAHEMLHAAYDRLSSSQKDELDAMLVDFYKNDLKDKRILDTIAIYKKSEPNDVVNEMHSIFGTEVTKLPAPLENYYKKYFNNRSAIAALANKYESEFTSRQDKVAASDAKLNELKTQIDDLEGGLKSRESALNDMQASMTRLQQNGDAAGYNARVPGYNSEVRNFNVLVVRYQNLVDQYNALLNERNAVAFEENQLNNALSSNVTQIKN